MYRFRGQTWALSLFVLVAWPSVQSFAGAGVEKEYRWPSRTIHYAICECTGDADPKPLCTKAQCVGKPQAVRDGINMWNDKAGSVIKLVARDPADTRNSYLLYVAQESETARDPNGWCSTQVGYSGSNGPHLIQIGDRCATEKGSKLKGSVVHETGHAVGLHHEQQRTDRDDYLTVKFSGSTANKEIANSGRMCAPDRQEDCEFQSGIFTRTYTYGQDLSDYDFSSIMHYPLKWNTEKCDLDCDAKGRCKPKPKADQYEETDCMRLNEGGKKRLNNQGLRTTDVGQRNGLSEIDIKALDILYEGRPF